MAAFPSASVDRGFFEKIAQFPPSDILQMCCLSRRSGELCFGPPQRVGRIYMQNGEVTHAAVDALIGEAAAVEILTWETGAFSFHDGILASVRTIQSNWEHLLAEATRRQNEAAGASGWVEVGPHVRNPKSSGSIPRSAVPRLMVFGGNGEGRIFELNLPAMNLGRAPENQIVIADASVSGRHCVFLVSGSEVTLRDLNSANGTFVNGQPVSEAGLRTGDTIRAGTALLRFELALRRPTLGQSAPQDQAAPAAEPRPAATMRIPRPQQQLSAGPLSFEKISRSETAPKARSGMPMPVVVLMLVVILAVLAWFLWDSGMLQPWLGARG